MSFDLAFEVSNLIAESQKRRAEMSGTLVVTRRQGGPRTIGLTLQQRRSEVQTRTMGALGMSDSALGFGLVGMGAVVVILLAIAGLWLDYIRFRDGTKWERILQGAAFIVGLLNIFLAIEGVGSTSPKVYGGLQMLRAGLDAYAAGHQIARSEHYIANGLALLGDAWGLFDGTRLLLGLGQSQGTVTNVDDPGANPNADQYGDTA